MVLERGLRIFEQVHYRAQIVVRIADHRRPLRVGSWSGTNEQVDWKTCPELLIVSRADERMRRRTVQGERHFQAQLVVVPGIPEQPRSGRGVDGRIVLLRPARS